MAKFTAFLVFMSLGCRIWRRFFESIADICAVTSSEAPSITSNRPLNFGELFGDPSELHFGCLCLVPKIPESATEHDDEDHEEAFKKRRLPMREGAFVPPGCKNRE